MDLTGTPMRNQLHIGIFGKRNSGKSTLINALTGNNGLSMPYVADVTTDPVYKTIEIQGIGSCVLIDTAGFDGKGQLSRRDAEGMGLAMERTDVAIIVCAGDDVGQELEWAKEFKLRKAPVIMVINKIDQISNTDKIRNKIYEALKEEPVKISAISRLGIEKVREEIVRCIPEDFEVKRIAGDLVEEGDLVLLVMVRDSQDSQNSQEEQVKQLRLQALCQLLDKGCIVVSCTPDKLGEALTGLTKPPKLIIADSEIFRQVYSKKPGDSLLTSFSVLNSR
ncbi:MAG TPA: GTP-binding protein [Clostridiales bacterium]|nr:GTP-binding protein [Clostridiales bacterium]